MNVARVLAAIGIATAAWTGEARASTGYSDEVRRHLALSYAPKCSLCHEGADGGTVDTPFAKSMLARGMRGGGDLASVDAALDAMTKDKVDSDGDGAIDVDELAYGGDPNVADKTQGSGPAATYGCGVTRARSDGPAAAVLLAIAFALARATRRSGRARRHALLFVVAPVAGCSSQSATPPAPCSVAQVNDPSVDVRLAGSGACAGTVALRLRVATGSPSAPAWSDAASAPVRVDEAWSKNAGGAYESVVTLTNASAQPVTVVGLEWSTRAGELPAVDRMLHNGYQSWSYTGIESIPATLADVNGTAPHGGDDENPLGEIAGVSWWWTALSDARGRGVVLGATGGTVFKTYVAVDGPAARARIVQGLTGDAITLAPGATRSVDGVYVAMGDVSAMLDDYAGAVAALHHSAVPRHAALGGWGSWNMYYANITASDMRTEAAWATAKLVPLGLTDFLLDDGYETHWGSWTASPAFGADLAALDAEQSKAGLRPALWMAPLYVKADDPLVAANPTWFVHAADGSLRTYNNTGPDYAALDVSSDGARAFVVTSLQAMRAAGYRTLKIDFLFGGAIEGVRQAPMTSLESYAAWMKTIREAVPDVHLVGCGAPMLPSVGWVDSMRIGPDIAYSTSPEPKYSFLSAAARHVAMRAMTDAWWWLDPDVVLLRGAAIDDATAWTTVVASAMAGGNYLLGDGRQAGDARVAMATQPDVLAMARSGRAARALDLSTGVDAKLIVSPILAGNVDTAVPHVWKKTSADGAHGWLAVFAWEVDGYAADVGVPAGAREIAASGASTPSAEGRRSVAVSAHGARLFAW